MRNSRLCAGGWDQACSCLRSHLGGLVAGGGLALATYDTGAAHQSTAGLGARVLGWCRAATWLVGAPVAARSHRSRSGVTRVTRRRARGPTRVPWSWAPHGPGGTVEEEANATIAHREASPRSRYKHGPRRREEFTSFLLLARFLSIGAVEVGFVFRKRLKCSKATDDWSWSSLLIKSADARLTARRVPVLAGCLRALQQSIE